MDENELTKTELWTKRIQDFHESGLSRKEWCQKHQIPQSTFGYWIRKQTKGQPKPEQPEEPVFARLPSEQEISSDSSANDVPVTICLPGSIRIEISAGVPRRAHVFFDPYAECSCLIWPAEQPCILHVVSQTYERATRDWLLS